MENYGLNQKIDGMSLHEFMASQIEKNEKGELELEKAKITIGYLKQMNNVSRLSIDAARTDLKRCKAVEQ